MKVRVHPGRPSGTVTIPPSKSMAHRAIICASLAQGESILTNVDYSDDIRATIEAMRQLGATICDSESTLTIQGIPTLRNAMLCDRVIDCQESGSTLRFLIPLASLTNQKITFKGKNRLLKRPQTIYQDIFLKQGLFFALSDDSLEIEGTLRPGHFIVEGNSSSQFISGLLFTLPLLEDDSIIEVKAPYESKSYVDLTLEVLSSFGITITQEIREDKVLYYCKKQQTYQSAHYAVEGDYSQLAFFAVLGAIHSPVECTGISRTSKQGDKAILTILKECGVRVEETRYGYQFFPSVIQGCVIDLKDCPDLGPILMVLGMFSTSTMTLTNVSRLRLKESDRIVAMEDGLKKLGVRIETTEHEIRIHPASSFQGNVDICGYLDHRIVMSFAIAATMLEQPIVISDAQAIEKSYPSFFRDLEQLGIKVSYDV